MTKSGMLKEGDSIDNYRGQIWDADRVQTNKDRHINFLYRVLGQEPDQLWVSQNWARLNKDADGKVVLDADGNPTRMEFWEEGESWKTAYDRDPQTAQTVLEDWGHNVALNKINWLKGREDGLRNVLQDAQVADIAGLETKFSGQIGQAGSTSLRRPSSRLERLQEAELPKARYRRTQTWHWSPIHPSDG